MATTKKTVLITGCSDGGLGSALALAFHATGQYRVFATARNLSKLSETRAAGIEELELDVLSDSSIAQAVKKLEALTGGQLDMLINNAGAGYNMPLLDVDITEGKKVFDLNVWSLLTVSRAFLPLLQKTPGARIVNNISVVAYMGIPIQGVYNASKAAANMMTETLRVELKPFGIKVIALITGSIRTKFFANLNETTLPEDSIYNVLPGGLPIMRGEMPAQMTDGTPPEIWAKEVATALSKTNPSNQVWAGKGSNVARLLLHLPIGIADGPLMSLTSMDKVEAAYKKQKAD